VERSTIAFPRPRESRRPEVGKDVGNDLVTRIVTKYTLSSEALFTNQHFQNSAEVSRLGGVVVSVLAIKPQDRGFKPGRGDGFLRAIKIRSTHFFGWKVKPEASCSKILRHVKDPLT
jgi:hypothetical protein